MSTLALTLETLTEEAFCRVLLGDIIADGDLGGGTVPGLAILLTGANIPGVQNIENYNYYLHFVTCVFIILI